MIREAREADAAAIARIYDHYVSTSSVTFDVEPKGAQERAAWLAARDAAHPVLVAEEAGEIVGWGALSRYRDRAAWERTAEVAVYVDPQHVGRGIGSRILGALIEAGRRAGHHALISQVVADNERSLAMTRRAGFSEVGRLREVGYKFGRWHDVVLFELLLG